MALLHVELLGVVGEDANRLCNSCLLLDILFLEICYDELFHLFVIQHSSDSLGAFLNLHDVVNLKCPRPDLEAVPRHGRHFLASQSLESFLVFLRAMVDLL